MAGCGGAVGLDVGRWEMVLPRSEVGRYTWCEKKDSEKHLAEWTGNRILCRAATVAVS